MGGHAGKTTGPLASHTRRVQRVPISSGGATSFGLLGQYTRKGRVISFSFWGLLLAP